MQKASGTAAEAAPAESKPPFSLDDPFLQDPNAEALRGAPRCLSLFIIVAIVYFFNLYCTIYILPEVETHFTSHQIKMENDQARLLSFSKRLNQQRFLGYLPVLIIMGMGILSLVTRYWGLFSGIFFTLIVLQFLLFLYGWVIFALPLIQLKQAAAVVLTVG